MSEDNIIPMHESERREREKKRAGTPHQGGSAEPNDEKSEKGRRPSQAEILLDIANGATLFHAPNGTGYADVTVNGHRETWQIRSSGFKQWLTRMYYDRTRAAPNSEALQSARGVVEARARFDAPESPVFVRVGGHDGRLYLDLGDTAWTVIEIGSDGWRIAKDPPVRFRRAPGVQPLPTPAPNGSLNMLRPFLNVGCEAEFDLGVAWLQAGVRNHGPYPVIAISGEQGSAKSTFSRVMKTVIDPNSSPLRALPREDRDLFIAATNGHALVFDNVSGIPAWISDTLCRLSTGGGFACRQLYSDGDEVLFDATRPIILNGIEDVVTRPDLAERSLMFTLPAISEDKRKPEKDFWESFNRQHPAILGALLDSVATGLRRLPSTKLSGLPRMADFALWGVACEVNAGSFEPAYSRNRADAITNVIEADPVPSSMRTFMEQRTEWTGTAKALLGALGDVVEEVIRKSKDWPASPRTLSNKLRRHATNLRHIGINIRFGERDNSRKRDRLIEITRAEEVGISSSAASASSGVAEKWQKSANAVANGADDTRTIRRYVDATGNLSSAENWRKSAVADGADDTDARIPTLTAGADEEAVVDEEDVIDWRGEA
jgi:hypothetical protein